MRLVFVLGDDQGRHLCHFLTIYSRTMSGNGARRGGRGTQKKRGPGGAKPLGKLALSAIDKNDALVERWLEDARTGDLDEGVFMAKVIKQYGLEFDVQKPGGESQRATVRGLFRAKGAFKNPGATTAVRVGGWVIVNEGGLGHMAGGTTATIVGVMTPEQSTRGKSYMAVGVAGRSSSNSVFNRAEVNAEARAVHEGEMAAHRRNLASRRRTAATRRRTSSNRTARSSESNASSEPNMAAMNDERKAEAKAAKLTRRKERRRAKKAAGAGSGSWFGWF